MGSALSEPITTKESDGCQDSKYQVGSSCMQGWRITMEDCHVHILSLPDDPDAAFFAVYDGHAGAAVAQYAGKHLHEYITSQPAYKEGNIEEAMKKGFLELDEVMKTDETLENVQSGTTVIAILIKDNVLYSANAGDSRAVASVNGVSIPLSYDHKPMIKEEKQRILAAGGWVEFNRVNGLLALSRALGDFTFKKNDCKKPEEQIVSALPDIQRHQITEDWEFVVLACDGIWDVMTNEDVVNFIRKRFADAALEENRERKIPAELEENRERKIPAELEENRERKIPAELEEKETSIVDPAGVCEQLITNCLAPDMLMGTGCDNMTVILVCFLHGKPYSEMLVRCREPPAKPKLAEE